MAPTRKLKILVGTIGALMACLNGCFCMGQIYLTSPLNNQVVQRNVYDSASIAITGYLLSPYKEVKIILKSQSGSEVGQTIDLDNKQIRSGFIHEKISASKGWHSLLVIGIQPSGKQDTAKIEKIGVGEVFLIAGNSNAMGVQDLGAKSASDHVVVFDTINKSLDRFNITVAENKPLQHPQFTPFRNDSYAYPSGETSWLWGELGDMLYQRMGTPVLFLNAGWAAANSFHYKETASGNDAFNHYVGKYWPNQQPYSNLANTLIYFNSWLGLRAVLWSHGENDAYDIGINKENYFNNIKFLIERSRQDFGNSMPWVIGQSSVTWKADKPYEPVISAQKELGNLPGFNTWLGPDSDSIQVPRPSHGHLENITNGIQGISLTAKAWNRNLSDAFFSTMIPVQPTNFLQTGPVPTSSSPGGHFYVPYDLASSPGIPPTIHAELLTVDGRYLTNIGEGNKSPLTVVLPASLPASKYAIRLVTSDRHIIGDVSAPIEVSKGLTTQLTRGLSARLTPDGIALAWLSCPHPDLQEIELKSSIDQQNFKTVQTFDVTDNRINSMVYAHLDKVYEIKTIFYEITRRYTNGKEESGGRIAVFQGESTPTYKVFPNPSSDQTLFIRPLQDSLPTTIQLIDIHGREHPIRIDHQSIIGLIEVRPEYRLPTGTYVLRIEKSGSVVRQTVVLM